VASALTTHSLRGSITRPARPLSTLPFAAGVTPNQARLAPGWWPPWPNGTCTRRVPRKVSATRSVYLAFSSPRLCLAHSKLSQRPARMRDREARRGIGRGAPAAGGPGLEARDAPMPQRFAPPRGRSVTVARSGDDASGLFARRSTPSEFFWHPTGSSNSGPHSTMSRGRSDAARSARSWARTARGSRPDDVPVRPVPARSGRRRHGGRTGGDLRAARRARPRQLHDPLKALAGVLGAWEPRLSGCR